MSSAFASVMGAPHPLARQPRITLDRGWPIAASAAAAVIVGAGATRVPRLALAAVALAAVVLVVAFAVRYRSPISRSCAPSWSAERSTCRGGYRLDRSRGWVF